MIFRQKSGGQTPPEIKVGGPRTMQPPVPPPMNATTSGKTPTDQVSCVLAHNGSGVFGAKRLSLALTSCVKVFRSKIKAISFKL